MVDFGGLLGGGGFFGGFSFDDLAGEEVGKVVKGDGKLFEVFPEGAGFWVTFGGPVKRLHG